MATTSVVRADGYKGGYRDRFWIPRFWDGINVTGWVRLLARNRFRIAPSRIPMALVITLLAVFNSLLGLIQAVLFGRRIAKTRIEGDPIFIVGHWRSGTTLLHELLVLDPRHTFPNTYACFAPNHYLLTRRTFPTVFSFLLPDRRPMDNMPAGWDRPQEDEFALCAMGVPSPYFTTMAFPRERTQDEAYLTLETLSPRRLARWKKSFVWFLRCVTLADPKRIVLKSPAHTGRIRVLLELFPKARFVHIVRDPYVLFASTVNLWRRLYQDQRLQGRDYDGLEERVFRTFDRMYAAFERDRPLIPPSQLSEVRYEDLVRDPIGQMRRIYDELALGGFEEARPAMEGFLQSQSGYKKNRYEISPETRAEIARRWSRFFAQYDYAIADDQDAMIGSGLDAAIGASQDAA